MNDELRVMIKGDKISSYCTFSSHIKPTAHFLRLYGSESTFYADFISRTVINETAPSFPSGLGRMLDAFSTAKKYKREGWSNLKKFLNSDYHFFVGLNSLISRYYESILNDTDVPIPYDQILKVSWMMEEIFKQLNHRVVEQGEEE